MERECTIGRTLGCRVSGGISPSCGHLGTSWWGVVFTSRRKVSWQVKRVLLTELGSPGGKALGRHRAGEGLDWLLGRCDSLSFPTTCCLFDLIPPSLLTDLHEAFLPYMDPQHHLLGLPYSPVSLQESTSNIRSAYILWPPNTSVSSDFSEPFGQRH